LRVAVHYDPYDLSQVWVRDHHASSWITVPWTHHQLVAQPFADFTWREARRVVATRGEDDTNQAAVARALAELLRRAEAGPQAGLRALPGPQQDRRQRRAVARGRAVTGMPLRPQALPTSDPDPGEPAAATATGGEAEGPPATPAPTARVIPFGVFDPFNEEDYW
jgi:hypothetical protein